jgi:hypothetical protein
MCYGGLDTKYIMADIEARVKGVAFVGQKQDEPAQPKRGALAAVQAWVARMRRKGEVHG